jgi:hypothetical protein
MNLLNAFKPKPRGDAETLSTLEAEIEQLADEYRQASHASDVLQLDDYGSDAARKAADNADALSDKLDRKRGALAVAQRRAADNAANKQAADDTASWEETVKLAVDRENAAVALEAHIHAARDAMTELLELGEAMHQAAPIRSNVGNSSASKATVEGAFRLYMVRIGFQWAGAWPWDKNTIPSIQDKVRQANDELLTRRPKVERAA